MQKVKVTQRLTLFSSGILLEKKKVVVSKVRPFMCQTPDTYDN